jgi:hypothetical protein
VFCFKVVEELVIHSLCVPKGYFLVKA